MSHAFAASQTGAGQVGTHPAPRTAALLLGLPPGAVGRCPADKAAAPPTGCRLAFWEYSLAAVWCTSTIRPS